MLDVRNCDCMGMMKEYPDKHFELAIIDPPYGIDAGNMEMGKGKNKQWAKRKNWDLCKIEEKYFLELSRISDKQIIWGGNYFMLPLTGGWIFWDKERCKEISFADGELAWTNFLTTVRKISIRYDGFIGKDSQRIHPTQKPVALYEWLLTKYAKKGDKILDTHMGSGSIAIACHNLGFDLTACELDKEYYEAAMKRINFHVSQKRLF